MSHTSGAALSRKTLVITLLCIMTFFMVYGPFMHMILVQKQREQQQYQIPQSRPNPVSKPGLLNRPPSDDMVECVNITIGKAPTFEPGVGLDSAVQRKEEEKAEANDRRPVLLMTYQACHGALSQHYGHLSAMVVAKYIGADIVVLPHARTRHSFGSRNVLGVQDSSKDNAWSEVPLSSVYEISSFASYLNENGKKKVEVVTMPSAPLENIVLPEQYSGFSRHFHANISEKLLLHKTRRVGKVNIVYKRRRSGRLWQDIIEKKVKQLAGNRLVIVDLGCTDIMVGTNPSFNATREDIVEMSTANEKLQLATYLVEAGRSGAEQMRTLAPNATYTGLHLRLERDMFADRSAARWGRLYAKAKSAFLDDLPHPLYIASGVFGYHNVTENREMFAPYYRTHVLYRGCLSRTLPNDVRPWVDYLVLKEAAFFQGHEYSVLSWLVVQQRSREGKSLVTSSLIRRSKSSNSEHPTCCEGDRCLVTSCTTGTNTTINILDSYSNP